MPAIDFKFATESQRTRRGSISLISVFSVTLWQKYFIAGMARTYTHGSVCQRRAKPCTQRR